MKGEWCYYNRYFDRETCAKILELGLQLPVQDAIIGLNNGHVDNNWRRSKVRFIQKTNPDFAFLFDAMWKMAVEANDQWFKVHISKMDYIQLAEYDSSYLGEYKKHHDVFWLNNDPEYHRKITAVVQLSDPGEYDGGNLEFIDVGAHPSPDDIRNQGSVVFFPSFILHQATQVTRGIRYSLACWFDGPKWR
jgi:PKHD-type hydroxylase